MSICLLIIQVSSTFYFSPTAPTCCAWTCIAVAPCVTCDEDGVALPKTASVWRLRRSEETQVTHRTVTLDVRYCRDHFPVDPHSDISFVFLFFFFFFFLPLSSSLLSTFFYSPTCSDMAGSSLQDTCKYIFDSCCTSFVIFSKTFYYIYDFTNTAIIRMLE